MNSLCVSVCRPLLVKLGKYNNTNGKIENCWTNYSRQVKEIIKDLRNTPVWECLGKWKESEKREINVGLKCCKEKIPRVIFKMVKNVKWFREKKLQVLWLVFMPCIVQDRKGEMGNTFGKGLKFIYWESAHIKTHIPSSITNKCLNKTWFLIEPWCKRNDNNTTNKTPHLNTFAVLEGLRFWTWWTLYWKLLCQESEQLNNVCKLK